MILPPGAGAFLFTDIEGSMRLLHDLGDAYAEALAEHRRVLRGRVPAGTALEQGEVELALERAERSLELHRRLGNDKLG